VNLEQNSEHSIDFCMLDYKCSYLPEQNTRMYYRYMRQASQELVSALIKRGWRRFGCYFFHPICAKCNECKSLRIDGCKSFAYKMNFKPMQILDGFPTLSQEPEWREI